MKTISEVRAAFWEDHSQFRHQYRKTWRQNRYNATIRAAFVDYVDMLQKSGQITDALADRVTL